MSKILNTSTTTSQKQPPPRRMLNFHPTRTRVPHSGTLYSMPSAMDDPAFAAEAAQAMITGEGLSQLSVVPVAGDGQFEVVPAAMESTIQVALSGPSTFVILMNATSPSHKQIVTETIQTPRGTVTVVNVGANDPNTNGAYAPLADGNINTAQLLLPDNKMPVPILKTNAYSFDYSTGTRFSPLHVAYSVTTPVISSDDFTGTYQAAASQQRPAAAPSGGTTAMNVSWSGSQFTPTGLQGIGARVVDATPKDPIVMHGVGKPKSLLQRILPGETGWGSVLQRLSQDDTPEVLFVHGSSIAYNGTGLPLDTETRFAECSYNPTTRQQTTMYNAPFKASLNTFVTGTKSEDGEMAFRIVAMWIHSVFNTTTGEYDVIETVDAKYFNNPLHSKRNMEGGSVTFTPPNDVCTLAGVYCSWEIVKDTAVVDPNIIRVQASVDYEFQLNNDPLSFLFITNCNKTLKTYLNIQAAVSYDAANTSGRGGMKPGLTSHNASRIEMYLKSVVGSTPYYVQSAGSTTPLDGTGSAEQFLQTLISGDRHTVESSSFHSSRVGDWFKKAWGSINKFGKTAIGKKLGGMARDAALKALTASPFESAPFESAPFESAPFSNASYLPRGLETAGIDEDDDYIFSLNNPHPSGGGKVDCASIANPPTSSLFGKAYSSDETGDGPPKDSMSVQQLLGGQDKRSLTSPENRIVHKKQGENGVSCSPDPLKPKKKCGKVSCSDTKRQRLLLTIKEGFASQPVLEEGIPTPANSPVTVSPSQILENLTATASLHQRLAADVGYGTKLKVQSIHGVVHLMPREEALHPQEWFADLPDGNSARYHTEVEQRAVKNRLDQLWAKMETAPIETRGKRPPPSISGVVLKNSLEYFEEVVDFSSWEVYSILLILESRGMIVGPYRESKDSEVFYRNALYSSQAMTPFDRIFFYLRENPSPTTVGKIAGALTLPRRLVGAILQSVYDSGDDGKGCVVKLRSCPMHTTTDTQLWQAPPFFLRDQGVKSSEALKDSFDYQFSSSGGTPKQAADYKTASQTIETHRLLRQGFTMRSLERSISNNAKRKYFCMPSEDEQDFAFQPYDEEEEYDEEEVEDYSALLGKGGPRARLVEPSTEDFVDIGGVLSHLASKPQPASLDKAKVKLLVTEDITEYNGLIATNVMKLNSDTTMIGGQYPYANTEMHLNNYLRGGGTPKAITHVIMAVESDDAGKEQAALLTLLGSRVPMAKTDYSHFPLAISENTTLSIYIDNLLDEPEREKVAKKLHHVQQIHKCYEMNVPGEYSWYVSYDKTFVNTASIFGDSGTLAMVCAFMGIPSSAPLTGNVDARTMEVTPIGKVGTKISPWLQEGTESEELRAVYPNIIVPMRNFKQAEFRGDLERFSTQISQAILMYALSMHDFHWKATDLTNVPVIPINSVSDVVGANFRDSIARTRFISDAAKTMQTRMRVYYDVIRLRTIFINNLVGMYGNGLTVSAPRNKFSIIQSKNANTFDTAMSMIEGASGDESYTDAINKKLLPRGEVGTTKKVPPNVQVLDENLAAMCMAVWKFNTYKAANPYADIKMPEDGNFVKYAFDLRPAKRYPFQAKRRSQKVDSDSLKAEPLLVPVDLLMTVLQYNDNGELFRHWFTDNDIMVSSKYRDKDGKFGDAPVPMLLTMYLKDSSNELVKKPMMSRQAVIGLLTIQGKLKADTDIEKGTFNLVIDDTGIDKDFEIQSPAIIYARYPVAKKAKVDEIEAPSEKDFDVVRKTLEQQKFVRLQWLTKHNQFQKFDSLNNYLIALSRELSRSSPNQEKIKSLLTMKPVKEGPAVSTDPLTRSGMKEFKVYVIGFIKKKLAEAKQAPSPPGGGGAAPKPDSDLDDIDL